MKIVKEIQLKIVIFTAVLSSLCIAWACFRNEFFDNFYTHCFSYMQVVDVWILVIDKLETITSVSNIDAGTV